MSGKFDLSSYETVKQRKQRFYEAYIDGRIVVEILNQDQITNYALFKASVFKDAENHRNSTPLGVGTAFELRDTELKVSSKGNKYESVNYTSWVENCEESAVGRALDNAGFASNMRCSREEIEKAERMKRKTESDIVYKGIIKIISELTDKFENKAGLQIVLNELGVKDAKEILTASYEVKMGILSKLRNFDRTLIDFPIPEKDKTIGPDYVVQYGSKYKNTKLKDIPLKEMEEYLDTLENRPTKKAWESELIEVFGTYLDMVE